MKKEQLINRWVSSTQLYYQDKNQIIDNLHLVHPDDRHIVRNTPIFTYFQCVSIEGDYLRVKSKYPSIRIKPEAVTKVYPDPKFEYGDLVEYNSSKKGS